MSELVTLITATGHRPEAFKLCAEYMQRQTYQGDVQWIVVSDSPFTEDECVPDDISSLHLIDRPRTKLHPCTGPQPWRPGINTQRPNLNKAIENVRGDYVLVIEDDDYYKPNYVEVMVSMLKHSPLVGETKARYYNLKHRCYKEYPNSEHASLCQTGFHKSLLPLFEEAVNSGELYIDIYLWKQALDKHVDHLLFSGLGLSVGMKGLPGRPGIGIGHRPVGYASDDQLNVLRRWIGKDEEKYLRFLK